MKMPAQLDQAIDGVYDAKSILFIVKECLFSVNGLLGGQHQEEVVGSAVNTLGVAIKRLETTIDDFEDVVKNHTFIRKDGGDMQ